MICKSSNFIKLFISHLVCATVAHITAWRLEKFVDIVWFTTLHKNSLCVFTRCMGKSKADLLGNFTIFYWRICTSLNNVYPIRIAPHGLLGCLYLLLPQNDTIPQKVGRHKVLDNWVLRSISFYWHHLGLFVFIARIGYNGKW